MICCVGFADDETLIAGGSAPAPWAHFLCAAKENGRKERPPGAAEHPLRFSPAIGACPNSPAAIQRGSGSNTRHATTPMAGCDARRRLRGWSKPPPTFARRCFQIPVWRTRAPQGFGRAPRRGRAQGSARLPRRDRMSRRGSAGTQSRGGKDECAIRGVFLLVPFLCTSKEKEPAVGQPPTSMRRRRRHQTGCRAKPPAISFEFRRRRCGGFIRHPHDGSLLSPAERHERTRRGTRVGAGLQTQGQQLLALDDSLQHLNVLAVAHAGLDLLFSRRRV